MKKEYMGDSVYAAVEFDSIVLTTENGSPLDPTNTIILNDEVWNHLVQYVQRFNSEGV